MIRILHFVSIPAIWSGVMNAIMNYYRYIDRKKIQFDFLCFLHCPSEKESYEKEIQHLDGRVFYVDKPGNLNAHFALCHFLQKHANDYQCFHNHEIYLSFYLKPLTRYYGISTFIVHTHTTCYSDRLIAAVRNRILCIPISFMKCERFACSKDAAIFLYGKKRTNSKDVFIMENAFDCQKYAYDPSIRTNLRKKMCLSNRFIVGHVGRFVNQKNHIFLIKVWKTFIKTYLSSKKQLYPKPLLLLIGDGPLRKNIQRNISQEHLEDYVLCLGQRTDIPLLLNIFDIFVFPSLFEGLGISLLEAQANGLTCIASNTIPKQAAIMNTHFLPIHTVNSVQLWAKLIQIYYKKSCFIADNRSELLMKKTQESSYNIINAVSKLENQYILFERKNSV